MESKKRKHSKETELAEGEIVDTEDSQTGGSQESQGGDIQEESQEAGTAEEGQGIELAKKKRKKDKKDKKAKKGVKSMIKEERQRKADELNAQRKEKALEKKKVKEEAAKEKAQLKRRNIRFCSKRPRLYYKETHLQQLLSEKGEATISMEAPSRLIEEQPEDPLETSLVEPGSLLVSLNPFEGEDEPMIRPTSGARAGAVTILTETIHEESTTERPLEAARGAPKKSARGKAPRKQAVPKKNRKTPGSGGLKYTPKPKHIRETRKAGYLYPDDLAKKRKNPFRPSHLVLNEIRHFQKKVNLLI